MRGPDIQQCERFSYKTLEERVPAGHPLRLVMVLVNGILKSTDAEFDIYAGFKPTADAIFPQ